MAYQNIQFPNLKLVHGAQIIRERPTTVVTNFAKEYRISRYATTKLTYVFPSRNITATEWYTLRAFFETVGWERDSFNLDPLGDGLNNLVKVRLDGIPTATVVAVNSNNAATMIAVSDIKLKQVFNE